ncbi:MAG: DNA-processing protein DprA [bacterium]|nr:DNA-processing protein DprA [bacterium]
MESIQCLKPGDSAYPYLLSEISSPPQKLYVRGDLGALNAGCLVAVVGTRAMSHYGERALRTIIPVLVKAGAVIVSGLAYGVDALAHQLTVESGGMGIAVLGSGVDLITPPAHYQLAQQLLESGGAIVSDYDLGVMPKPYHFPARNRIISGLSKATLVIEAPEKSGALITAKFALEQGREVYALPGNIFSEKSKGTNRLIADGAYAITSVEDLLARLELDWNRPKPVQVSFDSDEEKLLFEKLSDPLSVDELIVSSQLSAALVGQIVTMMELKGMVKNLGGMRYLRL